MKPKPFTHHVLFALTIAAMSLSGCMAQADTGQSAPLPLNAPSLTLLKTPNDGIQPQAALDSTGVLHLIYFKGEPMAGDIFYVRSPDSGRTFSTPLRVNSQDASAIATGPIRGAQLAIGKNNRVHIAWNGSPQAQPKGAGGTPMLYTRLNGDATAFEPQRNLITWAGGLDGGGTIAADDKGDVYVAWHAAPANTEEAQRAVYLARSTDDGDTFGREKKIDPQPTGACACCQMRALVDSKGALTILYRAAGDNVKRDSMLLVSTDKGAKFQSSTLHQWNLVACPMSTYALTESASAVRAAWETENQIYYSAIRRATGKFSAPVAAPGKGGDRKHPVLVARADGKVLLAWTEGTGWNRGGSLAWQIYDADGQPTIEKGRAAGVPVWGLLSAVARPDGGFVLIY